MAKRVKRGFFLKLLLLLFVSNTLFGQVLLVPEVQTNGLVLKQQVWSVVINNMTGQTKRAILSVSVTDRISSQPLLEANSGMILLSPGVKRVTYNELVPLSYNIAMPGFGADRQMNQPFPVGEYMICYRLTEIEKSEPLSTECLKVIAEPLSPPQLIQPENGSTIVELRPVLTWTPPAPIYMFNNLSYDIVVAPLYEKQSPQEALQRNLPVMTYMSANNSLLYPPSFTDLQAGKTYAWQVAAKDGLTPGGKSEVWTFTVIPDSVTKIINAAPYIKLDRGVTQTTILHQGILKMEYFNAYGDTSLKVETYILSDKAVKGRQQILFELPVKAGQNFLEYKINNKIRLDENSTYEVRLVNSRNEEWLMKFIPKYYF